jgi:predicted glycogen debranching enzyme
MTSDPASAPPPIVRSLVSFGREVCGDLDAALRREWLVTNGLGGYASGTVAGINTRRYHGLLVAALAPPVARTVLVANVAEHVTAGGERIGLATNEYANGAVDPTGYRHVESFRLEGMLPAWTFAFGGDLLEKRVFMEHGANTTYVLYRLLRAEGPVEIELRPLVTYREFHTLSRGAGWRPGASPAPGGLVVRAFEGAAPFRITANAGQFRPEPDWYWNFHHREEAARGLDAESDLFMPGVFRATLQPGQSMTLVLSKEEAPDASGERALARARSRQVDLLRQASVERAHPFVQQLTLAADQFIARCLGRPPEGKTPGTTVIAGYHWFTDWGRDTMIALPGLTLCTGRFEEAAAILRTFAGYVTDGLVPNNFPDRAGEAPADNTADATLWFVIALRAYDEASGDPSLAAELLPVLEEIVAHHERGTRHGIGVDPADGLLRAGEPGQQLTWMDARADGEVVTPRAGKPVEINALWYNALRSVASFEARVDAVAAARTEALAGRVRDSFVRRFWLPEAGYLADVVDGPGGNDATLRPNQVFAVSLPFPLIEKEMAAAVVHAVQHELAVSLGLRSLSRHDPAYRGVYTGGPSERDRAYHQGTAWTWLAGPFAEAHFKVHGDRAAALSFLRPFEHHLFDAGLGTVSEILDGDAPHAPRGAIAQAWGVAEVLRVWRMLTAAP